MNMRRLALALAVTSAFAAVATPVSVVWKPSETLPAKEARPFAGFLPDGRFVFAGGSHFEGDVKTYSSAVFVRSPDGEWTAPGELPRRVADGARGIQRALVLQYVQRTLRVAGRPTRRRPLAGVFDACNGV